ncbi:hypothetical protein PoB_005925400 [Plakobranchus ocellatus]|uniref:Uncharacterized protein n=1 Tax=Plakobranchus ocellatus TaxID=259542 RepID=A0AAV4CIX1_9GAST|nr:hypothetical protein PoB_005925400 [Plakobranchus ocellatus]
MSSNKIDVRHLSIREAPAKSNFDQALEGLTLDDVSPTSALVSCQHAFSGTHTTPLVVPIYHSSTYIIHRLEDGMSAFTGVSRGLNFPKFNIIAIFNLD